MTRHTRLLISALSALAMIFAFAARPAAAADISGEWHMQKQRMKVKIVDWGLFCGKKPRSKNWRKGGPTFAAKKRGKHFTLKSKKESFASDGCVSKVALMKVTNKQAGKDSWQVACENPVYRKPHESASYLYSLKDPDTLYFKEFTLVNYEEEGDPCHYTREREVYFKRGPKPPKETVVAKADAPAASAKAAQAPAASAKPSAKPVKEEVKIEKAPELSAEQRKGKRKRRVKKTRKRRRRKKPKIDEKGNVIPFAPGEEWEYVDEVVIVEEWVEDPNYKPPVDRTPVIAGLAGGVLLLLGLLVFVLMRRPKKQVPGEGPLRRCPECDREFAGYAFCPFDQAELEDTGEVAEAAPTLTGEMPATSAEVASADGIPEEPPAGEVVCPECKTPFPAGAKFCPIDRTPLSGLQASADVRRDDERVCPSCGTRYPNTAQVCPFDRSPLTALSAAPKATVMMAAMVEMRCTSCKNVFPPGAKFCPIDRTPLEPNDSA